MVSEPLAKKPLVRESQARELLYVRGKIRIFLSDWWRKIVLSVGMNGRKIKLLTSEPFASKLLANGPLVTI